jgi:hypothetical protein
MAKKVTYKMIWICDTCAAEIGTVTSGDWIKSEDAICIDHEVANSGHIEFTREIKIVLEEE